MQKHWRLDECQIQRKYRDLIILDNFSTIFDYLKICFDIFIKSFFLKNAIIVDKLIVLKL